MMVRASAFVTVMLLGPFSVRCGDGTELLLPKKAQALLAFLFVNRGRRISRDDLAALLWSNAGSQQARQSLRQCLSVLRRAFHPSASHCLTSQADTVMLCADGTIVGDLDEFERLESSIKREQLARADRLVRGELLAGLSVPSGPFEDWVESERRRFLSIRVRLLGNLADLFAGEREWTEAIETARRLVALDPFREESCRLLMELLAASDQRGLALIEHARVERMLREELQLRPDAATRALAETIRRGRPVDRQSTIGARLQRISAPASPAAAQSGAPDIAAAPRPHHMIPDRATVAIIPFVNLTGEPSEDHVVQSVAEDVAATLVRERWPVIVTTPVAGLSDCRARYVVGGSVRRDGRRVRVVVRLSDAASGRLLWSDRVEAECDSLFLLQDRLSALIVATMAPAIRLAESERVVRKPLESLTAYELYLRASAVCRLGAEGNLRAIELLERAIDLDPELGAAYALSARCFHLQRLMGWAPPNDPRLYRGVRLAHRAVELSGADPEGLWMSGLAMSIIDGNMRDGRFLIDQSLATNPNNASAWIASCFAHAHSGDPSTAIDHFFRAQRVNSDDASQHVQWHAAAMAYFVAERYDEADMATDRALAQTPDYPGSLRIKVATSALRGRIGEARTAARRLLRVNKDASVANMQAYWNPFVPHTPDAVAALLNGWRRAGMPES